MAEVAEQYADISTHTPHARRDVAVYVREWERRISTHTPHARRDSGLDNA